MTISTTQLQKELDDLVRRSGLLPSTIRLAFSTALDHEHAGNRRRYASVKDGVIEVAHAILNLPASHRLGVLAHEIGHLLAERSIGPNHTEDQADLAVLERLGLLIEYDHAWPGKGLQFIRDRIRGVRGVRDLYTRATVEVMDRHHAERRRPPDAPNVIVSIHSPRIDPADVRTNADTLAVIQMAFDDTTRTSDSGAPYTIHMALQLVESLTAVGTEVAHVRVHCDGGMSRSPAVAAALEAHLGKDPGRWQTRFPLLNPLVYRLTRLALG